eukprot:PhF_6_TR14696/c0_g1_i1/m.23138
MKRRNAGDADEDEELGFDLDDDMGDLDDEIMNALKETDSLEGDEDGSPNAPKNVVLRVTEATHPARALISYVAPERQDLKKFLSEQLGANRKPALEYYSVRGRDRIPRPLEGIF